MDFIPSFIARKHGRERVVYPHPSLEKVLANTYGIMVYQEQVMQTAQVVGRLQRSAAPTCCAAPWARRRPRRWPSSAQIFVAGAAREQHRREARPTRSSTPWRSSPATASTSRTPPPTRWSPTRPPGSSSHHPAAFIAATLSSEMANTDKVQFFYNDAKDNGLVFLPPDINLGGVRFQPVDAQHHPLRPRRHQGHRRIRARRDPQGARRGRPLHRPVRFLPPRRQARGQPPRRSRR